MKTRAEFEIDITQAHRQGALPLIAPPVIPPGCAFAGVLHYSDGNAAPLIHDPACAEYRTIRGTRVDSRKVQRALCRAHARERWQQLPRETTSPLTARGIGATRYGQDVEAVAYDRMGLSALMRACPWASNSNTVPEAWLTYCQLVADGTDPRPQTDSEATS